MPLDAPGSRTELTASTIISRISAVIITLTIRSTPPWSPPAQMAKPITTTRIMKPTQSHGLWVTWVKAAAIWFGFMPLKSPRSILTKNSTSQPQIVV